MRNLIDKKHFFLFLTAIFTGLGISMLFSGTAFAVTAFFPGGGSGDYPLCSQTCSGSPPLGDFCYNGPSTSDPGACTTPCGFGQTWSRYDAVCVQTSPSSCQYGYTYALSYSTGDKCISGETGLRPGYCGAGSYGDYMYKTCCSGSTPVACENYSGYQDSYDPPEGVCPSGSTERFCGFGGYPPCGAEACGGGGGGGGGSPPSPPTNLSASCPSPGNSATLSWSAPSGAEYYQIRVDDHADGWDGSCSSPSGDFCNNNVSGTWYSFTSTPSHVYGWWVHACNSYGCSDAASGPDVSCPGGRIQGYKVEVSPLIPGGQGPTTNVNSLQVWIDSGSISTFDNPYFFWNLPADSSHVVHTYVPAGYGVGYTLCYNDINFHAISNISKNNLNRAQEGGIEAYVTNINAPNGYTDFWWHFFPPPIAVISGSSTIILGDTRSYKATLLDDNGKISKGEIYVSPTSGEAWTLLKDQSFAGGSRVEFSGSWHPNATGTYYVVANAYTDWGGMCTGNPFRTPTGQADCGSLSRMTVNVVQSASSSVGSLTVLSTPRQGFTINSNVSGWAGTTGYTVTVSATTTGTLTASSTKTIEGNTYAFSSWSGCDSTSSTSCTVTVSGGVTKTVTANYNLIQPDLITQNLSVTNCTIAGNSCSFSGTVKNQGSYSAGSSQTKLSIYAASNNTLEYENSTSTGSLAAGATETETWSSVWTATAGTHKVIICADAVGNAVIESDENNNCNTSPAFTVVKPQCSDGINNDPAEDSCTDYPSDPGCTSSSDNSESGSACPNAPTGLNVTFDYCTAPLRPILSWTFYDNDPGDTQSAYQVQINNGAVLDTGKVISSSNSYVVPAPSPLSYNTTYSWRVRVWDSTNAVSDWSSSNFTTPPHAPPNPQFTWTPSSPFINEVVTFTDQSTCYGGCTNRLWDFGDGTSLGPGNFPTATHDYSQAGSYDARLKVWDLDGHDCQSKSGDFTVTVKRAPPKWKEVAPFSWIINALVAIANGLFR